MKAVLTTIMTLFVATSLFGQNQNPSLEEIMKQANNLPAILDVSLKTNPAPKFAAVQPTVDINFSFYSCSSRQFSVKKIATKDRLFVLIEKKLTADCAGPVSKRNYKLQVASDILRLPVIVLNPIAHDNALLSSIVIPPRMCTQIAGVLVHKESGRKAYYSNGCERADLLATGEYE